MKTFIRFLIYQTIAMLFSYLVVVFVEDNWFWFSIETYGQRLAFVISMVASSLLTYTFAWIDSR